MGGNIRMNIEKVIIDSLQNNDLVQEVFSYGYEIKAKLENRRGDRRLKIIVISLYNNFEPYEKEYEWYHIEIDLKKNWDKPRHEWIASKVKEILTELKNEIDQHEEDLEKIREEFKKLPVDSKNMNNFSFGGGKLFLDDIKFDNIKSGSLITKHKPTTITAKTIKIIDENENVVAILNQDGYRPVKKEEGE